MNRCIDCPAVVDFYGISLQKRGFDEKGNSITLWSRWTQCPNCGLFASYDENGTLRSKQKQEPPKTLFIPIREGKHE